MHWAPPPASFLSSLATLNFPWLVLEPRTPPHIMPAGGGHGRLPLCAPCTHLRPPPPGSLALDPQAESSTALRKDNRRTPCKPLAWSSGGGTVSNRSFSRCWPGVFAGLASSATCLGSCWNSNIQSCHLTAGSKASWFCICCP